MKIVGLDGREYNWPPRGHDEETQGELNKSGLHLQILEFLKSKFPNDIILQELPLPGTSLPPLRLDFFLPLRSLAVEADGRQHTEFIKFFHKNKLEFLRGKHRDRQKEQWLQKNGIRLLRLPVDKTDEWAMLLKHSLESQQ